MAADQELRDALTAVWQIPRPSPEKLFSAPAFLALSNFCNKRYGDSETRFALGNPLRSLGLPCSLPAKQASLALDVSTAADALDSAFTRRKTVHRHLCPLDLADDLPPLSFGTTRVGKFSADELATLFDAPRLARIFPTLPLESERLAQFHWLVVEEEIELDPRPEARAFPILFKPLCADFGEIDPHLGRFPLAVESALFFLLLARWEDWSTAPEANWCGFQVPWIYTIDDDLFVRPARPPSADSLTLEPWIVEDDWGDQIEMERPSTLPLDDCAKTELRQFTSDAWFKVQGARATPLFETPIAHFLVRAFFGRLHRRVHGPYDNDRGRTRAQNGLQEGEI